MSYGLAQARYASDATQTVSPARLLTMLYDRLVVDLVAAEEAMRRGDVGTTGDRIGHAQEIVLELQATLDVEAWSGGEPLANLYAWIIAELMQARMRGLPERVADCRGLVEPLRDAWYEAAALGAGGAGRQPQSGAGVAPDVGGAA